MNLKHKIVAGAAGICVGFLAQPVLAGAHTWDVVEVFSTADGSVQFIELREMNGGAGETFLSGLQVTSQSTGNAFTFPANLVGPTSNRHILLATASFDALPGGPAPDHIIPPNFFNPSGDTLRYHVYDTWVIGAGQVPTDCVNSLNRNGTTGPNTPTNYAGQTGQVDACPKPQCPADINGDQQINVNDLLTVIGNWGATGQNIADINGDLVVNVNDLLMVIGTWGPCV